MDTLPDFVIFCNIYMSDITPTNTTVDNGVNVDSGEKKKKDPKRVEQGKRLAEQNRKMKAHYNELVAKEKEREESVNGEDVGNSANGGNGKNGDNTSYMVALGFIVAVGAGFLIYKNKDSFGKGRRKERVRRSVEPIVMDTIEEINTPVESPKSSRRFANFDD